LKNSHIFPFTHICCVIQPECHLPERPMKVSVDLWALAASSTNFRVQVFWG
jgi:hypothetical protein